MKLLFALSLWFCTGLQAQPRLPGLPGLQLPELPRSQRLLPPRELPVLRELTGGLLDRMDAVGERLRREPALWMADAGGAAVLRRELLWLAPSSAARHRAEAAGWRLLQTLDWPALGLVAWRVAPPPELDAVAAQAVLQALQADEPGTGGEIALQHLYLPAGSLASPGAALAGTEAGTKTAAGPRIGLIDGGVDAAHPALTGSAIRHWGCGSGPRPSGHGTAVASLLVGRADGLRSAWPAAALAAADVYCDEAQGGTVSRLVSALDWLVREGVAVVNISLVGPPNRLLQQAVASAQARGLLLVAAVGNDGPAAPPLYPAAYPGVIAVSALDARRRPLPETGRGPHVMASAQGAALTVAQQGGELALARGSSFAAPWLAGRLAAAWGDAPPSPVRAQALLQALRTQLEDLGETGYDTVYGHGYAGPRWQPRP